MPTFNLKLLLEPIVNARRVIVYLIKGEVVKSPGLFFTYFIYPLESFFPFVSCLDAFFGTLIAFPGHVFIYPRLYHH